MQKEEILAKSRKEKSVLATAVLAGLASLFSLVSYILETLP